MNQLDKSLQNTEITCAKDATVYRLYPEHFFRLWLQERRRLLKKQRVELLQAADRLKQEIAAYDELLDTLTTR